MHRLLVRSFSTITKKESVVIIGTGWGGFKFLQALDSSKYDITIVSPRNHFLFTPLLASTSVGTLEFRCISEPIRGLKKDTTFYEAYAKSVDFQNKILHCENAIIKEESLEKGHLKDSPKGNFTLPYDKLIIACGAVTNTFGTPGVAEHAFFLKEISDARKIRKRIIDGFELAAEPNITEEECKNILHFAIVGGGPTGIELSAEIHDFIVNDVSKLYPKLKPFVKLTVFDVAPKILTNFDAKLGEYALKKFNRDGTEVRTGTKIKEVKWDGLVLDDGTEVKCGMVVWATGVTPNEFTKELPVYKDDKSKRILTDGYLNVLQGNKEPLKDVYALGDCAMIENYNLPQTAQVAQQKGRYLAKAMNNWAKQAIPFVYRHRGAMAYVGDWKALVQIPANVKGSGRLAWLFWRSSYFTM